MFACVSGICTLPSDTCPQRLEQLFALPQPSRSTLDLNMEGVDGGNTQVDHEVNADYTQGMFAGVQGGSHREPVPRPFGSGSFHLFKTQYQYEVFSVFGPASDDNEWGIELKWLKWLPLSFKLARRCGLQGNHARMRPPSLSVVMQAQPMFNSLESSGLDVRDNGQDGWVDLFERIDDRGFAGERRPMDSPPSVASVSDGNTNLIAPSETVEEMQHPTGSDFSEDGEPVLEATSDSSAAVRPEVPSVSLVAGPQIDPVDEESNSHADNALDHINDLVSFLYRSRESRHVLLPEVTLSAFTETGQAELSIKVPKQRLYIGRSPIISSSLADTPCTTLGIEGVLDQLNTMLGTSHTLDTLSLSSLLDECIDKNDDFGTAYAHLRPVWNGHGNSNMQNELRIREKEDKEQREKALVGNWIVDMDLQPRRVWDLYSNRVMPLCITDARSIPQYQFLDNRVWILPISHAWVDDKDRVDVWTSINGKEWPVPIPKGASLELIRIEMLNLGVEYTWLDVLCLRQKGGPWEDLRVEEWKLDVPTIGYVYYNATVVIYLSGLGWPLSLKDVQEVRGNRIIAGDTPDGPMHAKTIDEDGNYETDLLTRFHRQLELVERSSGLFDMLVHMQKRVSTNPVDRVAGLAFPLLSNTIPAYYESESLEDAWTALVDSMNPVYWMGFLFEYPGAGLGCKKWRPTWKQVMTEPLPADDYIPGTVEHDDETGEDWYEGFYIEKGLVQGLDVGSAEGHDQYEELVVEDADGIKHTFKICAAHQCLIPEDVYTLLGDSTGWAWVVGRRLPGQKFEKVSVFKMNSWEEKERLKDLDVCSKSHNILV
ncbi:hypothetical protein EV421DRAFT_1929748 [Armillaria borealis]|uniref:Heterokaryon incompatibility domain-containing protein n=1 Tax=Armillaria borealis TaxID=47425 RepID=A0AA39MET5_9AGAR|nr:hypothetical protein EV421DRAFT_1929748 [Armillaria borealis]